MSLFFSLASEIVVFDCFASVGDECRALDDVRMVFCSQFVGRENSLLSLMRMMVGGLPVRLRVCITFFAPLRKVRASCPRGRRDDTKWHSK